MGEINVKLKKYKEFIYDFYKSMPKSKLILFILLDLFLSFYIVTITFLVYSKISIIAIGLFFIYSFLIFNLIAYGCYKLKDKHIKINRIKEKLNVKTFIISSIVCL